jgi:hypothetical protein
MVFCYSFLLCNWFLYTTLSIEIDGTFCRYACGYGLEGNCGYPNHNQSIRQSYLIQFSIKQLYTQPKVAKIIFYHWPHTRINGEPTHGKLNGCHLWHQWCEIPFVHINKVWCTTHHNVGHIVHYKSLNMQQFNGMVKSF